MRPMPSLSLPGHLIWFAHCPKAGGTSIERLMVETWGPAVGHLHWGWDLWWRRGGWREAGVPNSPQHLVWRDARNALPRAPDTVFALVRDPLRRMESEHRWQRSRRRGTILGKALACLPFSLWLRIMLTLAARNPHAFDNHFRPQTDFIPEGAVVFRLEDGLAQVADWLGRRAGQRLAPPPHVLATTRHGTDRDPRDVALVKQVFAADYARFGYGPPALTTPDRPLLDVLARLSGRGLVWLDSRGSL